MRSAHCVLGMVRFDIVPCYAVCADIGELFNLSHVFLIGILLVFRLLAVFIVIKYICQITAVFVIFVIVVVVADIAKRLFHTQHIREEGIAIAIDVIQANGLQRFHVIHISIEQEFC